MFDYEDPLRGSGPKCPTRCKFCGGPVWFANYMGRTLCMEAYADVTERAGYSVEDNPEDERFSRIKSYMSRDRRMEQPDIPVYRAHTCHKRRRRNPSGPMLLSVCQAIEEFCNERV